MMLCPACHAENDDAAEICFTCREVLRAITRGTLVGSRYEIQGLLGRGGMGTVYRALDRVLDEVIALKVLRPEIAATEEMARRFRSEIRLARKVSHVNVCRIHEYAEEGSLRYISMELVPGVTLKEILRREGRLPLERARDIASQVAEGLSAIHRVGIVHRDVKSLNIMVDGQGAVKVMDFGIAKHVLPEGSEGVATGYVVGSPEYMSPEQARGRPVDFRSDVYSLGIVLYEMLSGAVPFRGDTAVATLLMHIETAPPLEGPEARELPAAILPVLRRSLAKEPETRYGSASEMAEALRQTGQSAASPSRPTVPRLKPPAVGRRRLRIALAVLAAGLVCALAIGVWGVVRARRPSKDEPPPVSMAVEPRHEAPSAGPAPTAVVPTRTPTPGTRAAPVSPPPRSSPASPTPEPKGETTSPTPPSTVPPTTVPPPPEMPEAPVPAPPVAAEAEKPGFLSVTAIPWADVKVDGQAMGQTPIRISLSAGSHAVLLIHPDYEPFPRRVRIPSGGTFRLAVDLGTEGVRRKR